MNLFSRPARPPGAVTAFTYIGRTYLWLAIARVSHLLAPAYSRLARLTCCHRRTRAYRI